MCLLLQVTPSLYPAGSNRRDAPESVNSPILTHLQSFEEESIHIMREVVAECGSPVVLYSIGKDNAVMLHIIAMKAFYPGKHPFPLLHIDTTWRFRDMIEFGARIAAELGLDSGHQHL
jgi:sulfate adenylyltransferase subunit 2